MYKQRSLYTTLIVALALLGFFDTDRAHADSITYLVDVNTSSISNTYGYVEFQFNAGQLGVGAATATITNFSPALSLNSSDLNNYQYGDVTGSLTGTPSPLTLNNDTLNDFFEGFTYGNSITFDVTLSGAGISNSGSLANSVGSSFAFSLYNSDTVTPSVVTTDPNNSVVTINVNGDGTTTPETFSPFASAAPPISSVPAPQSIVLLLTAVPVGWFFWRRSN